MVSYVVSSFCYYTSIYFHQRSFTCVNIYTQTKNTLSQDTSAQIKSGSSSTVPSMNWWYIITRKTPFICTYILRTSTPKTSRSLVASGSKFAATASKATEQSHKQSCSFGSFRLTVSLLPLLLIWLGHGHGNQSRRSCTSVSQVLWVFYYTGHNFWPTSAQACMAISFHIYEGRATHRGSLSYVVCGLGP